MLTYLILYYNTMKWFKTVFLYQTPNESGLLSLHSLMWCDGHTSDWLERVYMFAWSHFETEVNP